MMIEKFKKCLEFALTWEGGYSNNKNDPGGETFKGVTSSTFDVAKSKNIVAKDSVKDLSDEDVEKIYYELYYLPVASPLPDWLAISVFDCAVNQGIKHAILHLQGCLNDLRSDQQVFYPKLKEDGILGEKTIAVVNQINAYYSPTFKFKLLVYYAMRRDIRYVEIAIKNPKLQSFLRGWFRRTASCFVRSTEELGWKSL